MSVIEIQYSLNKNISTNFVFNTLSKEFKFICRKFSQANNSAQLVNKKEY
ncbi:hypothetical protein PALB_24940 [Pseudoalteromonas luteoviolacea B = ATCC 29581]|nr:hypothetical protein PALB_24940 [Pseudoalteromonas luteoviolacea B = ATCC 29581]